jgi:hypothetical protein
MTQKQKKDEAQRILALARAGAARAQKQKKD